MASLSGALRLTDELEDLTGRLREELSSSRTDFAEVVRLADALGEAADEIAETFMTVNQAVGGRLADLKTGRSGSSGARRAESSTEREEPTKDELLERAKELGIQGRSTMSKEELARAVEAAESAPKSELLERARDAGIEGRSSMTKDELQEAIRAEENVSKEELLERARAADLPGRSEMSLDELREALRSR